MEPEVAPERHQDWERPNLHPEADDRLEGKEAVDELLEEADPPKARLEEGLAPADELLEGVDPLEAHLEEDPAHPRREARSRPA